MTEQKWKVGDPVVIVASQQHHRQVEPRLSYGTVSKIARKYFTVDIIVTHRLYSTDEIYTTTRTDQFEIADGVQRGDPNYPQYRDHAYTPQEWEAELFRQGLNKRLREDHRVFGGNSDSTLQPHRWSDGHLVELVDLLDRVKAHNETKDLDR